MALSTFSSVESDGTNNPFEQLLTQVADGERDLARTTMALEKSQRDAHSMTQLYSDLKASQHKINSNHQILNDQLAQALKKQDAMKVSYEEQLSHWKSQLKLKTNDVEQLKARLETPCNNTVTQQKVLELAETQAVRRIEDLEESLHHSKEDKSVADKKIEILKIDYDRFKELAENREKEIESACADKVAEVENENNRMTAKVKSLEEIVEANTSIEQLLQASRSRVEKLTEELNGMIEEQMQKDSKASKEKEIRRLDMAKLKKSISDFSDENERLRRQHTTLLAQNNQLIRDCDAQQSEVGETRRECAQKIKEAEEHKVTAIDEVRDACKRQIDEMKELITEKDKFSQSLEEQVQDQEKQINHVTDSMNASIEEYDRKLDEVSAQGQHELKNMEEEHICTLNEAEEVRRNLEGQIDLLQRQLADERQQYETLKGEHNHIQQNCQHQIQEAEAIRDDCARRVNAFEKLQLDFEGLQRRHSDVMSQMEVLSKQHESQTEALMVANTQVDHLNEHIGGVANEAEQRMIELTQRQELEIRDLSETINTMKRSLEEMNDETTYTKEIKQQNEALKEKLRTLVTRLKILSSERDMLWSAIERAKTDYHSRLQELESRSAQPLSKTMNAQIPQYHHHQMLNSNKDHSRDGRSIYGAPIAHGIHPSELDVYKKRLEDQMNLHISRSRAAGDGHITNISLPDRLTNSSIIPDVPRRSRSNAASISLEVPRFKAHKPEGMGDDNYSINSNHSLMMKGSYSRLATTDIDYGSYSNHSSDSENNFN